MTGAERERLRRLVDQARRHQVAAIDRRDGASWQRCTGCGGVHYQYTQGCRQCSERRGARARRARTQAAAA